MTIPTTDDEFERLPPAIRRKYFSTLERLRLAQQPHKPSGVGNRRRRNLSCTGDWKPRTTADYGGRTPRRLRKLDTRNFVTTADAQWFLELPETIRRKHFTREEQILLAGQCESVILDPTDEALYKFGRRINPSLTSIVSTPTSGFFEETFDESFVDSFEKGHRNSLVEMDDSFRETFRWMDEEDDLDLSLRLDDYHKYIEKSTPLPAIHTTSRRPSTVRRTFSLTAKPFRRNSSSSSHQVHLPSLSQTPRPSYQRKDSISKHAPKLSFSATDKEAAYYQDPEARLKLRVYLASPQKFDEAIEFGFPATDGQIQNTDNHANRPKAVRKKSVQENTRSFLDDNTSLFHDMDDASTIPETEMPLTPQSPREFEPASRASSRMPSSSKPNSTDSHYNVRQRIHGDSYLHAFAGSREMTLRMTLTKPELRADENELYGFQRSSKDDPLALEELPPMSEDVGGTIGPFGGPDGWGPPREDGIVKKLWKKVKSNGQKRDKM